MMAGLSPTVVQIVLSVMRQKSFLFWLFFGVLLLLLLGFRDRLQGSVIDCYSFQITEGNLPHLIVLWALAATSIYTYCFLLVSTIRHPEKTFPSPGLENLFHWIYWGAVVFSAYVAVINFQPMLHLGCALASSASEVQPTSDANIIGKVFEMIRDLARSAQSYHLLLLVLIWSSLDLLVAVNCPDRSKKRFFTSIVCAIDLPVILSMVFVEVIDHFSVSGISDLSREYLRAGVIAFQLMAGGIAICMMEGMRALEEGGPTVLPVTVPGGD